MSSHSSNALSVAALARYLIGLMRISFSIIFFILFAQEKSLGQNILIVNNSSRDNVIYAGLQNSISISVEGYYCKGLKLLTDNGVIRKEDKCYFYIKPQETGVAWVTVKSKTNKLLGKYPLRVRELQPCLRIGPYQKDGEVKRLVFSSQDYVRIDSYELGCVHLYQCEVDSFRVQIFRDSVKMFSEINLTGEFNANVKTAFKNLQQGDVVEISEIFASCPDKTKKLAKSYFYIMQD